MKRYYYLVSSLKELTRNQTDRAMNSHDFMEFCAEQLDSGDFINLKKLYILNDIKNSLQYKKLGDPFIMPAYYEESEFIENLEDKEKFLSFFNRYFVNRENNIKEYPNLSDLDEIAAYFFEDLSGINNQFLRNYYAFELDLRNITTAVSLKKMNQGYENKLIPLGNAYEIIIRSNLSKGGLTSEFPYAARLLDVLDSPDSVRIEKEIDAIRWAWLDEYTESDFFSSDAVLAYALKLQILNRWANLEGEKGQKMFDDLVGIIKRTVKFSIEFSAAGEKK